VDEQAPKLLTKLNQGGYEREPLSMADLSAISIELKQSIAVREDRSGLTTLNNLCRVMLRQGKETHIPTLLRELGLKEDIAIYAVHDCVEQILNSRPSEIEAFLDALATDFPTGMETAAASIWASRGLSSSISRTVTPLQASALLRLPAEKRNAIMLRSFGSAQPFSAAFTASLLDPSALKRRSATQEKILLALAAADPPAALEASISLPTEEGDALVRSILASFASREAALAAIRGIKDAAGSQRAQAWLDALRPEPGK
jgi:hypothetical protein